MYPSKRRIGRSGNGWIAGDYGTVLHTTDGGDHWTPIVRDLPAVVSVEVQSLP